MAVPPLGAVTGVTGTGYLGAAPAAPATSGTGFAATLAGAVDGLTAAQTRSSDLAVQAVTGDLADIHDYTVAATEAQVTLELTAALRNKAVEAFTEIMRMQA